MMEQDAYYHTQKRKLRMSEKVKYIFNPFTAQLDAVQQKLNISANSITDIRNCLVGASIGDLVMESLAITEGVDSVVDNNDIRPIIGIIINKPTTTTCEVLTVGRVDGFVGLTKGSKIWLNTDGTVTSTPVATGYLQNLGTAREADVIDFNPQINRVKRT